MDDGISILDIWKLIMKQKILVSILFGIITILSFILILFVYNPLAVSYEGTFNYNWFGIENNKFANGQVFNYYDIISLDNIREVKRSKEQYQDLDVSKAIDQLEIEFKDDVYTIRLKQSLLQKKELDKEFIYDLIYKPFEEALNLEFDFSSNFLGYTAAKKISTKLDYLENQIDLLTTGYTGMITYFGDVSLNQKNLSAYFKELDAFISNNKISEFRYLAFKNSHMTKDEYESMMKEKGALESEQELLRSRKNILLESLRNIYQSSNGNTYMDTSIANYLNSLHSIDSRLMKINEDLTLMENVNSGNYNEQESAIFLTEIDQYKNELENFTLTYKENVQEVLEKNTLINVISFGIRGQISIFFAIIISFLLGIILSFFITFLIAYITSKDRKHKSFQNL